MEQIIQQIQAEYDLDRAAALRLSDQIFECYATPEESLLAVERAECRLNLAPDKTFPKKWIAMYPTVIVIVGERPDGMRVLLKIAELIKLRLT